MQSARFKAATEGFPAGCRRGYVIRRIAVHRVHLASVVGLTLTPSGDGGSGGGTVVP
jgi:hypothetical protein